MDAVMDEKKDVRIDDMGMGKVGDVLATVYAILNRKQRYRQVIHWRKKGK